MYFVDEVLKHFFSNVKIRDNTVFHRANSGNVFRRTTQHQFGFTPYGCNVFCRP